MLTQEELKREVVYCPDTGVFKSIVKRKSRNIGDICGGVNFEGYLVFSIRSKKYMAHRLAWLYMTGEHPKMFIDHINGIKDDNRFVNLRDVSNAVNQQNRAKKKASAKNKYMGICRIKSGKYIATICVDAKYVHLGTYETQEQAAISYLTAKKKYHAGYCEERFQASSGILSV